MTGRSTLLNRSEMAVLEAFTTEQLKEAIALRESALVAIPLKLQTEVARRWPELFRIPAKVARLIKSRNREMAWHVVFDGEGRPALMVPAPVRDFVLQSEQYVGFVRDDYRDKYPHLMAKVGIL